MKVFSCIFLFIPIALLAQLSPQTVSNPELDSHRNFSEIHLGDAYEKWKEFIFNKEVHNKQTFSCTLESDSCCNTVFDDPTSLVWVTFYENKVVSIRVELPNFLEGKNMVTTSDFKIAIKESSAQYINLVNKFNALFGRQFNTRLNENNLQKEPAIVTQWLGANTFLETQYFLHEAIYDPSGATNPNTGLTKKLAEARDKKVIILSDLNWLKNKLKSGF